MSVITQKLNEMSYKIAKITSKIEEKTIIEIVKQLLPTIDYENFDCYMYEKDKILYIIGNRKDNYQYRGQISDFSIAFIGNNKALISLSYWGNGEEDTEEEYYIDLP